MCQKSIKRRNRRRGTLTVNLTTMKLLFTLTISILFFFGVRHGVIEFADVAASFLIWFEEYTAQSPLLWVIIGIICLAGIALFALWLLDCFESNRRVPESSVNMARHRAESLIKF